MNQIQQMQQHWLNFLDEMNLINLFYLTKLLEWILLKKN